MKIIIKLIHDFDSLIASFNTNNTLAGIASICSIFSLIISVYIAINLKHKVKKMSDVETYNENRNGYSEKLQTYKLLISKRDTQVIDFMLITKIESIINEFDSYKTIHNYSDKFKLYWIKHHLKKKIEELRNDDNRRKVCRYLDYFISRFNKEERYI